MSKVSLNPYCTPLSSHPFWPFFVCIFIFCLLLPLLSFCVCWTSRYERGEGDLRIGRKPIYLPSISKTWRNYNAIVPVFSGAITAGLINTICLEETGNILCMWLGVGLAVFVFSFNDESGPIAKVHIFFAFALFIYLLWLVYALRIYFEDDYIWYWPYIPMGICFLLMLLWSYMEMERVRDERKNLANTAPSELRGLKNSERQKEMKEVKDRHWPWWVSLCEYVFVITFLINLILIP